MIVVNNLYKSFGSLQVLKGINEHIKPQEVVCVIGPPVPVKVHFSVV